MKKFIDEVWLITTAAPEDGAEVIAGFSPEGTKSFMPLFCTEKKNVEEMKKVAVEFGKAMNKAMLLKKFKLETEEVLINPYEPQ